VLGVLKVILRRDVVAGQGLGAGQFEVALVVLLGILDRSRLAKAESGSRGFSNLGFSLHWIGCRFGRGSVTAA